jgi:hypothetical protein
VPSRVVNVLEKVLGNEIVFLLEQVINGLLMGVYYLLIALGLSIISASAVW